MSASATARSQAMPAAPARPLKIAFVIDEIRTWGAGTEQQLMKLIAALQGPAFECELWILYPPESSLPEKLGIPIHVIGSSARVTRRQVIRTLLRDFRERRPDIVQTFFPGANLYGTFAAWYAGVGAIVASRRDVGYWQTAGYRLLRPLLRRMTTCWQCNSQAAADSLLAEGVPRDRIHILPNAIDLDYFGTGLPARSAARSQLGLAPGVPVFVSVANLRPVKDPATLVEAAARVRAKQPDVRILLIGEGGLRGALEARIAQLSLQQSVHLVGPQADVRPFLAAADFGVISSRSEGCSNALLEYMAAGLPAVVSDVPANRDLVPGVFFRPGDAADLAEKMLGLMADPDAAVRLCVQYRQRAQAFSVAAVGEMTRQYYLNLAARRTG